MLEEMREQLRKQKTRLIPVSKVPALIMLGGVAKKKKEEQTKESVVVPPTEEVRNNSELRNVRNIEDMYTYTSTPAFFGDSLFEYTEDPCVKMARYKAEKIKRHEEAEKAFNTKYPIS